MTWQYLACLLRSGELYEQLGAWEDAILAFKEGLLMVQSLLSHDTAWLPLPPEPSGLKH